jgi:membrane protease YdiL (CAAX protease family)
MIPQVGIKFKCNEDHNFLTNRHYLWYARFDVPWQAPRAGWVLPIPARNDPQQEVQMPSFPQTAQDDTPNAGATGVRSPLTFFLLVYALSIPLWLLGALTGIQLMEGLPISALMAFNPLIAALILTARASGAEGAKALLKRALDYRRVRPVVWYVPSVLLIPGISVLTYGLMRWMELPLPTPHIPLLAALLMLPAFFIGAVGEEGGWMGYAVDPLQDRWNALTASLIIGLVGAAWHIIPFVQAHRSAAWIAWQCLFIVASRVPVVWIYNNAGKGVFAAVLYHTTINTSSFLFPNYGSHYDPRITALVTVLVAAIVTVGWGPGTLARNKSGRDVSLTIE